MTRPLPTEDFDAPVVLADRYELSELLGRGGMAEVYAARDRKLGRAVAVKLLPAGRRDDGVDTRRLEDEARSAAALNHPHAVAVHDVGSSPHGVFVVMERLEGRTWRDELARRGRLSEGEVIEPAASVCDALAAAHDLGIVHRDVNPGNVMIRPDGVAKLMDFGIARVSASAPDLTATGVVVGTAAYMSPEQVRDRDLDGRSDVYSLGCTLYELLTGRVPFEGTSSVEVASARLRDTPPPPRRVVGEVSGGMEQLIMRALTLDPPRRPDAREMAAALRALTGSGPAGGEGAEAPVDGTAVTTRLGRDRTTSTTPTAGSSTTDVVDDPELAKVRDADPPSPEGPAVGIGMRRAGIVLVVLGVVALVAAVVVLLLVGSGG